MKKKKNEDRKKTLLLTTLCTTIALCVITILLIVALVKVFTKNNTPYYKVEERVEELNNFTEKQISYSEILQEETNEPNYNKVLDHINEMN